MKASIESAGNVASRVRLGDHELVFDQPRSVPGGEDRGPSPLDLMAVSVAALMVVCFLSDRRKARNEPP